MKRQRISFGTENSDISSSFLNNCEENFYKNPLNIVAKNAITSVGSSLAGVNSSRLNELDYVFLNSVKKRHVKATNQGHSGRCWMFAGLNMFRHFVIDRFNLDNFEFSETYLFFWDKLERSNSYMKMFIDETNVKPTDRLFEYFISMYMCDGGWFNTFANLVDKYGLIPKEAMKETCNSVDTDDMNRIIKTYLNAFANFVINNRQLSREELVSRKESVLREIYNILVKFLGQPPKTFSWSYEDGEGETAILSNLNPYAFKRLTIPFENLAESFITIVDIPSLEYGKLYKTLHTQNVAEGAHSLMLNLKMPDIERYIVKNITQNNLACWMFGDVSQDFNQYYSILDDKLCNSDILFNKSEYKYDKGEKMTFRDVQGNHAMLFTGVNLDTDGKILTYQVENSWGYWDNETGGMDGFLTTSVSWFRKNGVGIAVPASILSRSHMKLLRQDPIILQPWDSQAPACK